MNYYTIAPPKSLVRYVRFFWVLECTVKPGDYYVHRSMADGCVELIFHYNGRFDEIRSNNTLEKSFTSGIQGSSAQFRRFGINRSFGIVGVYLYPFAVPALFNLPASEVSNMMIDLSALLGREGSDLEEQIMMAKDNKARVNRLSAWLESRLTERCIEDHRISQAVKTIIQRNGQVSVEELAQQYCLSKRQFERRFVEVAGMRPKLYSRIIRFQSVFNELSMQPVNLSDVAYKCGYYDQSHFIHEFRQFSGFRPAEFLKQKSSEAIIWTT